MLMKRMFFRWPVMWNQPSREELAWAAGLFEGEGWISARYRGQTRFPQRIAGLSSTDLDVLQKFHQVVGVGGIIEEHVKKQPHHKTIWKWQTGSFEGAQHVGVLLWSWLGQRRRQAVLDTLTAYEPPRTRAAPVRRK